jgi:hypothetical protein
MPAPREIIASLESILGIFLSDIRHRERAAFILCDNLVEMACKTKARQHDYNFDTTCDFHSAWNASGVSLAPNGLGRRVQDRRTTRNNMQHADAAVTVETQHCADAILDVVRVINKCWSGTYSHRFDLWVKCALRIVQLYSSGGDQLKRQPFEDGMLNMNWRGESRTSIRSNESQIEPGRRVFWWLTIINHTQLVERCLDEIGIP